MSNVTQIRPSIKVHWKCEINNILHELVLVVAVSTKGEYFHSQAAISPNLDETMMKELIQRLKTNVRKQVRDYINSEKFAELLEEESCEETIEL